MLTLCTTVYITLFVETVRIYIHTCIDYIHTYVDIIKSKFLKALCQVDDN